MIDNMSNEKSNEGQAFWDQALNDALEMAERTENADEKRRYRLAADWFRYRLRTANPTVTALP